MRIDPRRTYSVRARILVDGKLWFTSDTAYPVLTRGAGRTVDVVLKMVRRDASPPLGGKMVYLADSARFTECLTGRTYPIALEGDFVKMQRAYLKDVKEPGARLYVTFEGLIADRPRMEGSGVERSVVVSRFINAWPNQTCDRARADASLTNAYWRIHSIEGNPVGPTTGRREPHLLLRRADQRQTYAATIGGNQLVGSYTVAGESIVFTQGPAL